MQTGTIRYGDMKKELAEGMVAFIGPIREKAEAIRNDEPYLRRVMEQGADKAQGERAGDVEAGAGGDRVELLLMTD